MKDVKLNFLIYFTLFSAALNAVVLTAVVWAQM